jgi:hypothetical protein
MCDPGSPVRTREPGNGDVTPLRAGDPAAANFKGFEVSKSRKNSLKPNVFETLNPKILKRSVPAGLTSPALQFLQRSSPTRLHEIPILIDPDFPPTIAEMGP